MAERRYVLTLQAPVTAGRRKSYFGDPAAALVLAWRRRRLDWTAVSVERAREVLLAAGELARACDRMDELIGESPGRSKRAAAGQALREAGVIAEAAGGGSSERELRVDP